MTAVEEAERRELSLQRDTLVLSKREHETQLISIKNLVRVSGRMPTDKYRQCCDSQATHARAILHIEDQLRPIKARLRELSDASHAEQQVINANGVPAKSIVADLVALRDDYQRFAADGTRVSSMRQMSAE